MFLFIIFIITTCHFKLRLNITLPSLFQEVGRKGPPPVPVHGLGTEDTVSATLDSPELGLRLR